MRLFRRSPRRLSRRLTHEDRAWVVLILGLIAFVLLLPKINRWLEPEPAALTDAERRELQRFEQWHREQDSLQALQRAQRRKGQVPPLRLHAFDPNRADSVELLEEGLTRYQAHNALQYCRAGGVWRSAEHFATLYGLDAETFARLRPYLRFPNQPARESEYDRARRDSIHRSYAHIEKYAKGTKLDLALADTTALQRIPGVGAYYAQRIVRYREALGGFVSTAQLAEIDGLPTDIASWFHPVTASATRRIAINRADFKTLVHHPYLSYEQVCDISNYARLHGAFNSLSDLLVLPSFSPADTARLAPYLSFMPRAAVRIKRAPRIQ